jgi:adenylate cyclase
VPDLIAQGVEDQQRWRRSLPAETAVVLGRSGGPWAVPWDPHISRRHATLRWSGEELEVGRLPETHNPIFLHGKEIERGTLRPGEHFVIGHTTFTLADQRVNITSDVPDPIEQQSFSAQYLRQVQFRHPDHRIEVLSRLPDVISGAAHDAELVVRLVTMLLAGVVRADAAAVVAAEEVAGGEWRVAGDGAAGTASPDANEVRDREAGGVQLSPSRTTHHPSPATRVLHWDQRLVLTNDFKPSQGLIVEALRQRQSVLHVWRGTARSGEAQFTESETFDWAFCTPVLGKACAGWGLYLAGRFNRQLEGASHCSDPSDLREDVKFTELVAAMLSSLRQMRQLEHRQATLSQFFSPVVLETLAVEDPEVVLAPRETTVSVMFCDLRGFARETERSADDLLGLLARVSTALGVMTHHIREEGGVVGDFQGDAALGFWGWPLPQPDAVRRTSQAALGIRHQFEATANFHAGIGIATGRAVAGKIGTTDQVKVTVFGPVVNLASRLEGMTKLLQVPILVDEVTARAIRNTVSCDVARVRRLAVVRPYGMDTPLEVSELLPPAAAYPELTDAHLESYEAALDAFLAGRWREAFHLLHRIPSDDRAKDFMTVYMAQHNRTPPPHWDGVIPLGYK